MTDYITIPGVRKRSFTIQAKLPEMSPTLLNIRDDTYISRNGDTYVARNGDTYVAHNYQANPRIIKGVKKRNFKVQVTHG